MPDRQGSSERRRSVRKWAAGKFKKVYAVLMESGLGTKRQAQNLAFHLSELLEAGLLLRGWTDRLVAGAVDAKKDASLLDYTVYELTSEMYHIIYHARLARRCFNRLASLTRRLPPLRGMSDDQIAVQRLNKVYAELPELGIHLDQPTQPRRPKSKATRSKS